MDNIRFTYLFEQYYKGQASADEKYDFFSMVDSGNHDAQLKALVDVQLGNFEPHVNPFTMEVEQRMLHAILDKDDKLALTDRQTIPFRNSWLRIAVAAIIMIIGGVSLYLYQVQSARNITFGTASIAPILPGKQSATLTLADGKKIILSDAANGNLATEAGIVISKTAGGSLIYEIKANTYISNKTNILSTANGESYKIRLPDGSIVTLNAASTLTYAPSLYKNGERRVALSGEGYFEVAKDRSRPFIVSTAKQEIRVLGTHFNVSAYVDEEATKTTLVEGSVGVSAGVAQKMLVPGQQAVVRAGQLVVSSTDLESAVAWKNGEFVFTGKSINEIMKMLSRWYNVEVEFKGPVTKEQFEGSTLRTNDITEVLELLELTEGIHFKIEGRKIIVSK